MYTSRLLLVAQKDRVASTKKTRPVNSFNNNRDMFVLELPVLFKKNLNASKPSEHPPQVEECLKV